MNEPVENVKALVINGTIWAHYAIEKQILFLKMRKQIYKDNPSESENILFCIIKETDIDGSRIRHLAYLNIK